MRPVLSSQGDSLFSHAGNDVVAEEADVIAVACPRNPFEPRLGANTFESRSAVPRRIGVLMRDSDSVSCLRGYFRAS
jgi:hypothetical protein